MCDTLRAPRVGRRNQKTQDIVPSARVYAQWAENLTLPGKFRHTFALVTEVAVDFPHYMYMYMYMYAGKF